MDEVIQNIPVRELPEVPPFRKMVGPSLILLGLGLGSGEVILWPYLVSNWGLGIIWAAALGITMQFFLNMEVERYTLIRGESVFVGFARLGRFLPIWFIISTFVGWFWPGIIAAASKILAGSFGSNHYEWLAISLLVLIGLTLTLGPVLYKTVETYQKVAISVGISAMAIITLLIVRSSDWLALGRGLIGLGEGYHYIPRGIPLFTLLGALAYAGAGGNLNLAQSFYVKEKGYGMGAYSGRISSLLTGKEEQISLTGSTFIPDEVSLGRFQRWWKMMNLEHAIIFWGLGLTTIIMLALLAYTTNFGVGMSTSGLSFVIQEANAVGSHLGIIVGMLFLFVLGAVLFGTQLTVLDSTSRIMAENLVLTKYSDDRSRRLPHYYYSFLWGQILLGIMVFLVGFSEPRQLIVIGAVVNSIAMFVAFCLILLLNKKELPKPLQPVWWRKLILVFALLFFAFFAGYAVLNGLGVVG